MMENVNLENEMVNNFEEFDCEVISKDEVDVCNKSNNATSIIVGVVLTGAIIAGIEYGPTLVNKAKGLFKKKSTESLEDKRTRLLNELAIINAELVDRDNEQSEI